MRRRFGMLSGGTGIVLNVLLFLGKLIAGLITGSVAIVADALNNLSDTATSIVTMVGFRLAGQAADKDHPFGHGRVEYVTGLVVALAILLMGAEIGKSSIQQLFSPDPVAFSWVAVVILVVSILVKLWMFFFNRTLGRTIDSAAMKATAADSLSDTLSTGVVLASMLMVRFLNLQIDGLAGLLVAALILKTGWDAAQDTLDPLLGRAMNPKLASDISNLAVAHPNLLGIHDLVYHDYGPGRAMMSFHAEVPADGDMLEMHDLIDHIERELKERHNIETVIHMDPVVNDERTQAIRQKISDLAQSVDERLSVHDVRITPGPRHTNIIFDVVVPFGFPMTDEEITTTLKGGIKAISPKYYGVIQVEHSYVDGEM